MHTCKKENIRVVLMEHLEKLLGYRISWSVLLTAFSIALAPVVIASPLEDYVSTYALIEKLPIYRAPPVYPRSQAQKRNAGSVELVFMVDEKGRTYAPMVVTSTSKRFEKVALRAVRGYRYEAVHNQKGMHPFRAGIKVAFEMERADSSAVASFNKYYEAARTLLQEQPLDQPKIRAQLNNLVFDKNITLQMVGFRNYLEYEYAFHFGTEVEQLEALGQAMGNIRQYGVESKAIDELSEKLWRNKFELLMSMKRYGDALNMYIGKSSRSKVRLDSPKSEKELNQALLDESRIEMQIEVGKRGYAQHYLFKKLFWFEDVVGKFTNIKLRCDRAFIEHEFKEHKKIVIPDDVGTCHLQLFGKAGAIAKLVQR